MLFLNDSIHDEKYYDLVVKCRISLHYRSVNILLYLGYAIFKKQQRTYTIKIIWLYNYWYLTVKAYFPGLVVSILMRLLQEV